MKKFIGIICCFMITVVLYIYICVVVSPKSIEDSGGTSYYRGMGFLAEPKNSIDVMVYGNSDVYSGFSPAKLFDEYGYTSYTSGTALQTIGVINHLLKRTIKTQTPKVVVLDVDCLYEKLKFVDNTNLLLAPFTFHARWKEINSRDFYTMPDRTKKYDISKGYVYSDKVYKFENINYMGNENARPLPVPRRNLKQLEYFIDTCKNNDIEIILIELPSATSWNFAKHNFIEKYSRDRDIPFIDMNVKDSNFNINYSRDFRDNGDHLNVNGAEKATLLIGEYLSKNYNMFLTDKRNHSDYAYWKDVVDNYIKNKS
ncbi:hypothetical protein SH1V18_27430 [Vallitalea longa]|uniref:SGNH/GDSL hydrolase family protein n=1 Tax=Vallitalea longa TaxID=2936439 RepID=A0A9W5YDB2_9FIRM|nr:hypothetical protein [Vallitalea longa]GKX30263.1 hypothetical protein SH1V18_27430 [Vallitalea longa]